jgi:nitroreductase/Pyruvate/2-oxoacid:ferredoxin oxidoreductase delta subunit
MKPTIDKTNCVQCKLCVIDCPANCIDIENFSIGSDCIECAHCIAICPNQAVQNKSKPILLEADHIEFNSLKNFITNLRTIRNFKNKEIEKGKIEKIISELRHAPSASNSRNVGYTILTNKEDIIELNNIVASGLYKKIKAATNFPLNMLIRISKGANALNKLKKYRSYFERKFKTKPNFICYNAPAIIISYYDNTDMGMMQTDSTIWASYISFMAKSLGLATCFNGFIEMILKKNAKLHAKFGIPKNKKIGSVLLIGYPNVKYTNQTQREMPDIIWK